MRGLTAGDDGRAIACGAVNGEHRRSLEHAANSREEANEQSRHGCF